MVSYCLGFGLAVSWLWLFYLIGPLLEPVCTLWGISSEIVFRYFISSVCVTSFVLFQILKIRSIYNKKFLLWLCVVVLSLGPLLTAILPSFPIVSTNPIIPNILAILSGIALSFFYTSWMETLSITNLRKNYINFALGILLSGSMTMLGGFVPFYWTLPFCILAPPLSLILMWRQKPDESTFLAEYQKTDSAQPLPIKLFFLISLIYISGGTVFNIISIEQSFVNIFYLSNISYVSFCLIAGTILYYSENLDLRLIYRFILPLLSLGFLIFSTHGNRMAITGFVLLQGGLALLDMYTWLVIPYFARFSTRPASVCAFGLFIMTFSILIGNVAVDLLTIMFLDDHNVKNSAFIAGLLSILAIFLFPDEKETFSGWQALFIPKPQVFGQKKEPASLNEVSEVASSNLDKIPSFSNLQLEYDYSSSINPLALKSFDETPLSPRERDVLILLQKGRSGRFISENLNISSNTVKFHIRNIYSKLHVSNRQELLNLFENENRDIIR